MRVPVLTVINTDPRFFWLTNYIETVLSAELWKSCTTATIAYEYKRLLTQYAVKLAHHSILYLCKDMILVAVV